MARPSEDGGVAVTVRDTGLGMTSGEIAVALTPFAQVDSSRARWRDGTGLGLPMARPGSCGELTITSERSRGTEVTVRLPSRFDVSQVGSWESPDATLFDRTRRTLPT
jgi:two-component system cell cycle sensor histidine kinase PleC